MIIEQGTKDDARVSIYTLAPGALVRVRTWLDEIEGYWSEQLAAFKAHAEGAAATSGSGRRRRKRCPDRPPTSGSKWRSSSWPGAPTPGVRQPHARPPGAVTAKPGVPL